MYTREEFSTSFSGLSLESATVQSCMAFFVLNQNRDHACQNDRLNRSFSALSRVTSPTYPRALFFLMAPFSETRIVTRYALRYVRELSVRKNVEIRRHVKTSYPSESSNSSNFGSVSKRGGETRYTKSRAFSDERCTFVWKTMKRKNIKEGQLQTLSISPSCSKSGGPPDISHSLRLY